MILTCIKDFDFYNYVILFLQFSLPMRLKQVHLFNAPPVFDALYQMAKPFLKDKTINRVSDKPFIFDIKTLLP